MKLSLYCALPQSFGELVVFAVVLFSAYYLMKTRLLQQRRSKENKTQFQKDYDAAPFPPGPIPWPIIGNVISLGDEPHLALDKMSKKYGPIFRIRVGSVPVLALNSIEVLREALHRQRDIFSGRPHFDSYKLISLGRGAVFNDRITLGDKWKDMKMKMVKHIHDYAASMSNRDDILRHIWNETVYMTKTLEEMCVKSPTGFVDPEQVVRVSVGNALCATCFGRRYEVDNAQFIQLLSMNREFGVVISAGSRIDVMPWIKIFPYYKKAAEEFEALCLRMENWVLDKVRNNTISYRRHSQRNLIDSLTAAEMEIRANQSVIDDDAPAIDQIDHVSLSALVNDIFGAGQDTLSGAYLFILHYLIRFPEVQKKLRKELHDVVGTERLPTLNDRANLPFLEAMFHEIMRHSSYVAITIPHLTLKDTILCGYKVPKNTMVFINQYTVNRDSKVWKNPYDFNPERFLKYSADGSYELDSTKVNKYTIFSIGARKCPGDEISKLWILLSMALFVHQCEILPDPDNPPTDASSYGLTMKPYNLRINIKRLPTSIID